VLADIGTPSVEVCRDVLHLLGHQDRFEEWLADQSERQLEWLPMLESASYPGSFNHDASQSTSSPIETTVSF
jgi:hypothetical protein